MENTVPQNESEQSKEKSLLIQRIRDGSLNKSEDLMGAKLSGANLSGANLSGKDLSGANLSGADLFSANLSDANLSDANLSGANLSGANLFGVNLSGANLFLFGAKLSGTDLSGTDFREADLRGVDLSGTDLRGTDLRGTDLREADLRGTDLRGTDLRGADLRGTDLRDAVFRGANLREADLRGANLREADLRGKDLSGADLRGTDLRGTDLRGANLFGTNLFGTNLSGANLSNANLSGKDLSGANLSGANLSDALLQITQAIGTDFTGAILTGACIEDWHINRNTKLDGVTCEYIYLKNNQQERRPHIGTFVLGDFAKLVQSSLETIDLIFREGLDWQAFAYAFKQIEVQYGDAQLAVQSIENKGDGVVIVKIATAPTADKEEIHSSFMNGYELASKVLAAQYEARLQDKDKHNEARLQDKDKHNEARLQDKDKQINELLLIININSEVTKAVAESKSGDITFNQQGATIGSAVAKAESGSRIEVTQNIFHGEKKSLAEAAAEIQRLLSQLEKTNPTTTESEQVSYVNVAIKPELKQRAIAALKAGSETAIDEFVLENKFLKVVKAVVKGWIEPSP